MSKTIAVLDDEADIVELISVHLKKAGFKVKEFLEVKGFFDFIEKESPDLVILDLMLPDADGFEICRYLRTKEKFAALPIIMLTARGDETDKVLGLELGADDYITKPFSPRELVARVKVALRRQDGAAALKRTEIGGVLEIDFEKYEVFVSGERVELTSTEFRILRLLSLQKGRVYSREQLLDHLWGTEKAVLDRTIDVHIKNLRDKLGPAGSFIKNIRGVGYKLET
ncbi:MAG: response regulator [Deltaproteobacteria bacterium]|nr:response regulator [Deltaproteobacteria bacterium]